jgi:hypothetical protein
LYQLTGDIIRNYNNNSTLNKSKNTAPATEHYSSKGGIEKDQVSSEVLNGEEYKQITLLS